MKHALALAVLLAFTSLHSFSNATAAELAVNTNKSVIRWVGRKATGQHQGTLKLKNGTIVIKDDEVQRGVFVIDMTTIKVTDIETGTDRNKLEGHLNSPDFFAVESHSIASFVLRKSKLLKREGNTAHYHFSGSLILKDTAQPVEFEGSVTDKDGTQHAHAKITIDRTRWNIQYNSKRFFDIAKLGDKLIYDGIDVELDLYTK